MTDVTTNLEALGQLAKQITGAAEATADMLGNLDDLIDQRARLSVAAELGKISAKHRAEVDELNRQLRNAKQRHEDVLTEIRKQFGRLSLNYQRAAAALRASGDPEYRWGKRSDVAGEPPAKEPGEQILHWLEQLMPASPDGRHVFLLGDLMVTANPEGDLRGNEAEMHPLGRSRVVPISALVEALAVLARVAVDDTAAQLQVKVRNVLVGHGVPAHVGQHDVDVPQPAQ